MIKVKNSNIIGVSKGSESFSEIYKGSDLVWRKKPVSLEDLIIRKGNEVAGDVVLWDKEHQTKILINIKDVKKFPKASYTPIGLVAIPSSNNLYGDGSGSMVSLRSMDCNSPDSGWGYGDGAEERPCWGSSATTLGEICSDQLAARNVFNQVDINTKFRNYSPYDWKSSPIIYNVTDKDNYPAGFCCWRYYTEGTKQGDWYLPSSGEVSKTFILNIDSILLRLYELGYSVFRKGDVNQGEYKTNTCTEIRYDQQWFGDLYSSNSTLSLQSHSSKLYAFAFCKI